ncbi:hypothetical protein YC2023_078160 [Brassica napus]
MKTLLSLAICPILKDLYVHRNRHEDENVKKFTVKVPSLETLECVNEGLIVLNEEDVSQNSFSSENVTSVSSKPDDKLMRSLSSLKYLEVGCCQDINFSQLMIFQRDLFTYCNQPISVPVCMSTNIEIFEWKEYSRTAGEKKVVRYILANSKCLNRLSP